MERSIDLSDMSDSETDVYLLALAELEPTYSDPSDLAKPEPADSDSSDLAGRYFFGFVKNYPYHGNFIQLTHSLYNADENNKTLLARYRD